MYFKTQVSQTIRLILENRIMVNKIQDDSNHYSQIYDNVTLLDLSIIMPCLNEEENISLCINQARTFIDRNRLTAEIIVVDNGSVDSSAKIAISLGARVISEPEKGYGRALRTGFAQSRGTVIIFGDCDSTYDFLNLEPIFRPLADNKVDFMTGDRFGKDKKGKRTMQHGAMSLSHRIGVPFLSWCGRMRYGVDIHDFHCGMRGIRKDALEKLEFKTTGMEFATEMIAEARRKGLRIGQVTVALRKSKYARTVKLRTVRDGLRHLIYIVKNG